MVLRVPRAFRDYACERSMVCCVAPMLAPVTPAEEAALGTALGATEAGRALLPELGESIDRTEGTWRQQHGRCVHLGQAGDAPACRLQHAAGLAALPIGCRNFPRIVNASEENTWDVTFELMCPTAARLLTEHPEPWELVTVAREGWPYPPSRQVQATPERVALRDAWWGLLREVRADPARLVAAIGAMLDTPETPSAGGDEGRISDAVMAQHGPMAGLIAVQTLSTRRERGAAYDRIGQTLLDAMLTPWPKKAFVDAVTATPEYVAVFLEHGVGLLTMHASFAKSAERLPATSAGSAGHILGLTARRALAVVRLVDTACTLLPFRTATLFADAYQAVARLDPTT